MKAGFIIATVILCVIPFAIGCICYFTDEQRDKRSSRRSKKYMIKRSELPETDPAIKLQETQDGNSSVPDSNLRVNSVTTSSVLTPSVTTSSFTTLQESSETDVHLRISVLSGPRSYLSSSGSSPVRPLTEPYRSPACLITPVPEVESNPNDQIISSIDPESLKVHCYG